MITVVYKNLYMNVFGVTPVFFSDGTFSFSLANGDLTVSGYYKIFIATLNSIRLDSESDFHSLVSDIVSFHSLNSYVTIGDNNVGVDLR